MRRWTALLSMCISHDTPQKWESIRANPWLYEENTWMAEIWNYETIKELLYAPGLGHYFTYGLSGRPKDKFGLGTGRVYPWRNNRLPACEKNGGAVQSLPAVSHPPSRRDRGYASINLEIKKPSTPPSECWVFPFKQINFLRTFKPERQAPLRKNNGIRLTALRLPAFFENILSIFALYKFYYTL